MFGITNTNYGKIDYNRLRSNQDETMNIQNLSLQEPVDEKTKQINEHINYVNNVSKDPNIRYSNFMRYIVKKDAAGPGK